MATKNKKRPRFPVAKIIGIVILVWMNFGMIHFTISTIYEDIIWHERLSMPNMCTSDLADGDYISLYETVWLYRETGEEAERFWKIAYAYDDMIDCITYRQAAEQGIVALTGADYERLAAEALARINDAAENAEVEQDRLVFEYFAAEAETPVEQTN